MASTLTDPRVLVSLRDPVDRLWSQFRFIKTRFGPIPEDMTFEEYADRSVRVWRAGEPPTPDTLPFWHLAGGMYADHIEPWFDVFGDSFRVVFFEQLVAAPKRTVSDVADWLGLDPTPVAEFSFSVENRTVPIRSTGLQRMALFMNREDLLGRHRRLKAPLRRLYYSVNRRRGVDTMPPSVEAHLRTIVAPANARLAAMLRARGYEDLPGWLES
jgi:hypothetical protein